MHQLHRFPIRLLFFLHCFYLFTLLYSIAILLHGTFPNPNKIKAIIIETNRKSFIVCGFSFRFWFYVDNAEAIKCILTLLILCFVVSLLVCRSSSLLLPSINRAFIRYACGLSIFFGVVACLLFINKMCKCECTCRCFCCYSV